MNWDAISTIVEFAGFIAVVISLMYFARQIKESNIAQQTSADCMIVDLFNQTHSSIIQDPEIARIVNLAREKELTDPTDIVRMRSVLMQIVNAYALAWRSYKAGHLSEHSYTELVADTRILFAPGMKPLVKEDLAIRSKEFVAEFLPDFYDE